MSSEQIAECLRRPLPALELWQFSGRAVGRLSEARLSGPFRPDETTVRGLALAFRDVVFRPGER